MVAMHLDHAVLCIWQRVGCFAHTLACLAAVSDYCNASGPCCFAYRAKSGLDAQALPCLTAASDTCNAYIKCLSVHRAKGGLDAERAERVKCKQEDMDRDRRNFEAMQVCLLVQSCDLQVARHQTHAVILHALADSCLPSKYKVISTVATAVINRVHRRPQCSPLP